VILDVTQQSGCQRYQQQDVGGETSERKNEAVPKAELTFATKKEILVIYFPHKYAAR
jgi:hypothetical protein